MCNRRIKPVSNIAEAGTYIRGFLHVNRLVRILTYILASSRHLDAVEDLGDLG